MAEQVKTVEEIRDEVKKELQTEYDSRFEVERQRLEVENKATIQAALQEWRRQQEPPSQEDISRLLSQEYLTFTIKLKYNGEEKEFEISELPMMAEKRFYKLVKEKLLPKMADLSTLSLENEQVDTKIKALFSVIDPAMDLLAEAAEIVLNPRQDKDGVNSGWIKENLSSFRIWNILHAQMEANRLRDFFSGVSRTSKSGKMSPAASTLN